MAFLFFFGVILFAAPLFAQTQKARPSRIPPAPDQATVERGRELFSQNCSFCHGKEANGGDGGPDLIRSVLVNHDENGSLIAPVVLNGRPGKGMPKFPLAPAQISDIATFLHARNRSVRYRQLYQIKNVITGDAKAGAAYFKGAGKCDTCHSSAGDLAHVASKYEPEALMRRFLYPGGRTSSSGGKSARTTVTITLRSGQSFSGPLQHIDEFTVSMYDSSGDYHTWARNAVKTDVHDPLAAHLELLRNYTDTDMHNVLAYLETLK
ncbi:MAG TPA: cytochrome c [Bryobacteraceae bacterium]|nr:cytochrome c [Bryobacteraceae bacterium]